MISNTVDVTRPHRAFGADTQDSFTIIFSVLTRFFIFTLEIVRKKNSKRNNLNQKQGYSIIVMTENSSRREMKKKVRVNISKGNMIPNVQEMGNLHINHIKYELLYLLCTKTSFKYYRAC